LRLLSDFSVIFTKCTEEPLFGTFLFGLSGTHYRSWCAVFCQIFISHRKSSSASRSSIDLVIRSHQFQIQPDLPGLTGVTMEKVGYYLLTGKVLIRQKRLNVRPLTTCERNCTVLSVCEADNPRKRLEEGMIGDAPIMPDLGMRYTSTHIIQIFAVL
jgi:hypothetical protein